jgi:acetyl esterase/lipase
MRIVDDVTIETSQLNWRTVRAQREAEGAERNAGRAFDPRVQVSTFGVRSQDGHKIPVHLFRDRGPVERGAFGLFLHGGGFVLGSTDMYRHEIARYVIESGVPILSVDYRRAGEVSYPVPLNDCFAALQWLVSHADVLAADLSRLALVGESAGAGLAAALAIRARDEGIGLAKQILVYPMLDDRNVDGGSFPDPTAMTWTFEENHAGWSAMLGSRAGQADVEPTAAPARLSDFSGLAPAYVEVGENDIFRDEAIAYAMRLHRAGVSAELHVHPFAAHGFDRNVSTGLSRRAWADRVRVLASLKHGDP